MLLWNVRSINNKVDFVMQYIINSNVLVACITESWLIDTNDFITFRIKSYGYEISHKHREEGRGGGICFIYNSDNKIVEFKSKHHYTSFEYHIIEVCTTGNENNCLIICIYRRQEVPFSLFQTEFSRFCEYYMEQSLKSFIVLGDFNVHCETNNYKSTYLLQCLLTV